MTLDLGAINWLAVFSSMVVYVILGAAVFAPQLQLGKAWMAAGAYESPASSKQLSDVLRAREIPHELDLWGYDVDHDWPWWRRMLDYYVGARLGW